MPQCLVTRNHPTLPHRLKVRFCKDDRDEKEVKTNGNNRIKITQITANTHKFTTKQRVSHAKIKLNRAFFVSLGLFLPLNSVGR